MIVIEDILIESIHFDKLPVNKSVLDLVFFLMSGGEVPPVKLQKSALGGFKLKDGRHRVCAFKLMGFKTIKGRINV